MPRISFLGRLEASKQPQLLQYRHRHRDRVRHPVKIRHKIGLPFTLLFAVVTLITASTAMSLMARQLDQRLNRQMTHAANLVAKSDFGLNRAVLEKVKALLDADILTFRRDGEILVSTIDTEHSPSFTREVTTTDMSAQKPSSVIHAFRQDGVSYRVIYRPLEHMTDTFVALVVATADIDAAKRAIAWRIGVYSVGAFLVLALISLGISRTLTRPIESLVRYTRELAAGRYTQNAIASQTDELNDLSTAFDEMAGHLRVAEEKLVHSEKLAITGQLAARVAHDVRNPLSSIKMQAQLLRSRAGDNEQDLASLKTILHQTDRVERVIQELLDLSRPATLKPEPQPLNAVVEDALSLMDTQFTHLKVSVQRQLAPGLPDALIDAERLKQALLNVLDNAVEAMPQGGQLTVTTRLSGEGDTLVVQVIDEGEGIPPDRMKKLFSPFFTTKRDGVGLGLVNAKSILDAHHGSLRLESSPAKGTTTTLSVPVAPEPHQQDPSTGCRAG